MRLRTFPVYISFAGGGGLKRTTISTPILTGPVIWLDLRVYTDIGNTPPRGALEFGYSVGGQVNEQNVSWNNPRPYTPLTEMVRGGDPASVFPEQLNGIPLTSQGFLEAGVPIPLLIPIEEPQVSLVVGVSAQQDLGLAQMMAVIRCVENVPKSVIDCLHMWALQ